ncbi:hypothetical protein U1Q18_047897 [Sarracenia purpurea var. burkii]
MMICRWFEEEDDAETIDQGREEPEDLTKGTRSDRIHDVGLKVHEYSAMRSSWKIRVAVVPASVVDAVLVTNQLPELCLDLVATLPALDVDNFSHLGLGV